MEKHLLISKGCKGWGGPLTITPGQGKKIAYITGGIRPPVVDRLSELTGWPSIDVFKNGEPPAEESFEATPAFAWLQQHAGGFGFTMSYPRGNPHGIVYEPWHWCYAADAQGAA